MSTEPSVLVGTEWFRDASFSPDGKRVVTASHDNTARVWDAETGKEMAVLEGHSSGVKSASFSPDGRRVVTGSFDETARIWDAESGKEIARLEGHRGMVNSAAFSPDGKRVVTTCNESTASIWDAESGKEVALLEGHEGIVNSASFSGDGKRVVTASSDHTARLWHAGSAKEIQILGRHEESVNSASFSPDGKRVVTASGDNTARIWDVENGTDSTPLRGHEKLSPLSAVLSASFSPDGKRVVTSSNDNTARIWETKSGKQIAVLKAHTHWVLTASFSPDGRRVVTASSDHTVRIWDVTRTEVIARDRGVALTSSLANGIGQRTAPERTDLLLQDAEEDLFAEASRQLVGRLATLPNTTRELRAPLHPNCYLTPTEFAKRFGLHAAPASGPTDGAELEREEAHAPSMHSEPNVAPTAIEPCTEPTSVASHASHCPPVQGTANPPPHYRRPWALWLLSAFALLAAIIAGLYATGAVDIWGVIPQANRNLWR